MLWKIHLGVLGAWVTLYTPHSHHSPSHTPMHSLKPANQLFHPHCHIVCTSTPHYFLWRFLVSLCCNATATSYVASILDVFKMSRPWTRFWHNSRVTMYPTRRAITGSKQPTPMIGHSCGWMLEANVEHCVVHQYLQDHCLYAIGEETSALWISQATAMLPAPSFFGRASRTPFCSCMLKVSAIMAMGPSQLCLATTSLIVCRRVVA